MTFNRITYWLKISTLCPSSLSSASFLSRNRNFPEVTIKLSGKAKLLMLCKEYNKSCKILLSQKPIRRLIDLPEIVLSGCEFQSQTCSTDHPRYTLVWYPCTPDLRLNTSQSLEDPRIGNGNATIGDGCSTFAGPTSSPNHCTENSLHPKMQKLQWGIPQSNLRLVGAHQFAM